MEHEIDWVDEPPMVSPAARADLLRCGPTALPPLIALNTRHVGAELHFWQGRSYPHVKENCPACAARNNSIWKGYIGVWNPASRQTAILEFTLGCVSALDAYYLAHTTCRGASITLKRSNGKPNGKLLMTCARSIYGSDQLPPAPDVRLQLSTMWGSKRDDHLIATAPTRPVVEPGSPESKATLNRRNLAAIAPGVDTDNIDVPLSTLASLVKDIVSPGVQTKNGRTRHDGPHT